MAWISTALALQFSQWARNAQHTFSLTPTDSLKGQDGTS